MTTILLSAGLVLAALAVSAPAQANPCHVDDASCMVDCILGSDMCCIYRPDPRLASCPTGETGVVVVTGANSFDACVPSVSVSSCPERGLGVVVWIGGEPTDACVLA